MDGSHVCNSYEALYLHYSVSKVQQLQVNGWGDFLAYKGYCLTYWATWGLCDPGAPWENVTQLQAK